MFHIWLSGESDVECLQLEVGNTDFLKVSDDSSEKQTIEFDLDYPNNFMTLKIIVQ